MSQFFISYSRKDLAIAEKIINALAKEDLEPWIDWKNIPKGEKFEKEIYKGIEESEIFLLLISPDSVNSNWCNKEVEHAVENGKRILPVVVRDTNLGVTHFEISKLNWIFCRDGQDEFNKAIGEIYTTIHTDYEWLKYHTFLQNKALVWERHKDNSRLLRGKELKEAIARTRGTGAENDPSLTELQQRYLLASKRHERNLNYWKVGVAVIILILLAWPFFSRERAIPGQWISIPAGPFIMGMDEVEANFAHSMCIAGAANEEDCMLPEDLLVLSGRQVDAELEEFEIMDNEVTNAQYQQCVVAGDCQPPRGWSYDSGGINNPATNLNWFHTMEYCKWLGGRLPTEGEWEKAARGPNGNYFPWGNIWDATKANLEYYQIGTVQSIAQYAESDISHYGVKNLAGNVQEWTISENIYLPLGQTFQNNDMKFLDIGPGMPVIVRGGAWVNVRTEGMSSNRGGVESTSTRRDEVGFRCACPDTNQCTSPWDWKWVWFGN